MATTISGAGARGKKRSIPTNRAIMTIPRATVGSDACGMACRVPNRLWTKVPLGRCTPISLGTWSRTMTSAIPALKPINTGSEMKLAMKPNRRSEARSRIAPTRRVSVAEVFINDAGSPAETTWASWAAARMASVVVVLTLSGRDVPSSA